MAVNDLSSFISAPAERTVPFTFEGVQFEAKGTPGGDKFFAILYPDQDEARKQCVHFGAVNKRSGGQYPVAIYGDVIAIQWAVKDPNGEPLDLSVIFALYDSNPVLFSLLRAAALDVWGVDDSNRNSGYVAWNELYGLLTTAREAQKTIQSNVAAHEAAAQALDTAFEIVYRAMQDYRADLAGSEPLETLDPAMEKIEAGNP